MNIEKSDYIKVNRNRTRIILSLLLAFAWVAFSWYFAINWLKDFDPYMSKAFAYYIVVTVAIIPGLLNMFLVGMVVLRKDLSGLKREFINNYFKKCYEAGVTPEECNYPELDVLIAAHNEEEGIASTIESILTNGYKGKLNVFCIDDGSTDSTYEILSKYKNITVVRNEKNIGKSASLNKLLALSKAEVIANVDADSIIEKGALASIVESYKIHPNCVAVAGNIKTHNNKTFIQKLQRYDYEIAIFAIKTTQAMMNGVLVAQGAFSVYRGELLRNIKYQNVVGEDIVVTWKLLENPDNLIFYDKNAVCYTNTPNTLAKFYKQRIRWARGMIEGVKQCPGIFKTRRYSTAFNYGNLLFPLLDFTYVFIFTPAAIMALVTMKSNFIVGVLTLLIVPLGILQSLLIARKNKTKIDWYFIPFLIVYCFINQSASFIGYIKEILGVEKKW